MLALYYSIVQYSSIMKYFIVYGEAKLLSWKDSHSLKSSAEMRYYYYSYYYCWGMKICCDLNLHCANLFSCTVTLNFAALQSCTSLLRQAILWNFKATLRHFEVAMYYFTEQSSAPSKRHSVASKSHSVWFWIKACCPRLKI